MKGCGDDNNEDDDDEFGLCLYPFYFFKPKIGDSLFGHSNTVIDSLLTFYWATAVVHNKIYIHLHTIKRALAVFIDSRIFFPAFTFRYNRKRKKEKNIFAKQNSLLVRSVFIFFYL